MTTWTCELKDLAGSTVVSDAFAFAPEASFGFVLNGAGPFTLKLPVTLASASDYVPGQRTFHVKADGTTVCAGFLLNGEADHDWVNFSGRTWEFAMSQSLITTNATYLASDQLDTAWDLINDWVTFPTGITRGSATPSGITYRQRRWCCDDMVTVEDAINDLASAINGFDWWLTPAKVWTTAYPHRQTNLTGSVTLSDTTNLVNVQYEYDAESVTNRMWFTKPDVESCTDLSYRDDGGSPATWVREGGLDLQDKRHASDRADIVDEALRNARPRIQVTADIPVETGIDFGTFDIGDKVATSFSRGWMTSSFNMKVMEYTVNLAESCVESISVTLDKEVGPT